MNHRKHAKALPSTTTESVLLELFAASVRSQRLIRSALLDAPLTADEFAVYSLLGYRGPVPPARLANALGMQRSTLSNYLSRMEERGDIERATVRGDRRSVLVQLSPRGRDRVRTTMPYFRAAAMPFRRALGDRWDDSLRALREISAALDSAAEEFGRR